MDETDAFEELSESRSTFISTMCYREMDEIEIDVLDHDGHVVFASINLMHGRHGIWRAMHECATCAETEVLFVAPTAPVSRGTIQLIEDELERSPLSETVWGVERSTQTEISFDNDSRIVSHHVGGTMGADRIRGYHPDLLVVDNYDECGETVDDRIKQDVLIPMLRSSSESDVWINDTSVRPDDPLVQFAFEDGAYVEEIR